MGRLDAILSVGGRLDAVLSVVGRCIKPWKRREFGMGAILFEFTSKWLWRIPKYWTPLWNSFIKTKYNLQFNGCDAKLIVKTLIFALGHLPRFFCVFSSHLHSSMKFRKFRFYFPLIHSTLPRSNEWSTFPSASSIWKTEGIGFFNFLA